MKASAYIQLMILGIAINTLPRFIDFGTFSLVQDSYSLFGKKVYFAGQALSFLLILVAHEYKGRARFAELIYRITLWLAISNLMDELFFDPIHFGINELIFALLIITSEFYFYTRKENSY